MIYTAYIEDFKKVDSKSYARIGISKVAGPGLVFIELGSSPRSFTPDIYCGAIIPFMFKVK